MDEAAIEDAADSDDEKGALIELLVATMPAGEGSTCDELRVELSDHTQLLPQLDFQG